MIIMQTSSFKAYNINCAVCNSGREDDDVQDWLLKLLMSTGNVKKDGLGRCNEI